MPAKAKKRRRPGVSTTAAGRLKAEHPNHVWALDYCHDATDDGRELKFLNVVDEFTRERPWRSRSSARSTPRRRWLSFSASPPSAALPPTCAPTTAPS